MITSNVIHRTFHIKRDSSTGTAFTIDRDSKQYIVTARHVVEGVKSGNTIEIFHEHQWKNVVVDVAGIGVGEMDVAVLSCPIQLSPSHILEADSGGLMYGQYVYFLGYPFGWDSGGEQINRGVPLPFVKGGIVSAIEFGDVSRIFLDAHGNKGFSGGPVVFVPNGRSIGPNTDFKVAGIVVNYPTPRIQPVVNQEGTHVVRSHLINTFWRG